MAAGSLAQNNLKAQLDEQFGGAVAPQPSRNAEIRIIEGTEHQRHATGDRRRRPPAPTRNRRLLQDLGPANLQLGAHPKEKRETSKELFDASKLYGNYLSDSIENSSLEGSFRDHIKLRQQLPPKDPKAPTTER